MTAFKGFRDGKPTSLPVPAEFFTDYLVDEGDADQIKLLLCIFRLLNGEPGAVRYFYLDDLLEDVITRGCFAGDTALSQALQIGCTTKTLLEAEHEGRKLYFLNTPLSSGAWRALQKGAWTPDARAAATGGTPAKPNIFTLYEKNIGPMTPILAETLEDAEKEYPAEWLEEAIKIAVKKNVRNWQYVEAILRSWKEKGRNEEDRRNAEENPRRYIEGDLADYIKH
jgi:DnaD/phage-associated family protein